MSRTYAKNDSQIEVPADGFALTRDRYGNTIYQSDAKIIAAHVQSHFSGQVVATLPPEYFE